MGCVVLGDTDEGGPGIGVYPCKSISVVSAEGTVLSTC